MIGLCKGAHATLVIPADEGYGDRGSGAVIAGGATLNSDVGVVDANDLGHTAKNVFTNLKAKRDLWSVGVLTYALLSHSSGSGEGGGSGVDVAVTGAVAKFTVGQG